MSHFAIIGSRGYPSTYGGFETFVRRLAPYLVEQGEEVTVYCRDGDAGEVWRDGVRCVTTRGLRTNAASTLSYGLTAALDARKRDVDAALVLNVANGFFLPILRRAGIPTAVNVDGIEWQRAKWNRLGKEVFRRGATLTAEHAGAIIVDSQAIGDVWLREFNRTSTFIPYGADVVEDIEDKRVRALGIEPGSYVLAVARLAPENNIDMLLDAAEFLPSNLPIVIVGSANKDNATTDRLAQLAARRPNFLWLGHVHDQELLAELWSNCLVYFHGHSVGGTNPALLQALGFGAPTVAVHTAFNAEVLTHPSSLASADPCAIASRIESALTDPELRAEMRRHGHATVRERYSWRDVLANYHRLLISCLPSVPRTLGHAIAGHR